MVFAVMMVMTISASALSSSKARRYSLYLSDKMAYELDLTADQYEAVYQINYDYFRQVYTQFDVDIYWPERDLNMYYVLDWYQYEIYSLIDYFYNPIMLTGSKWYLGVYSYYPSRYVFYRDRPLVYRSYRGYYMTNPGSLHHHAAASALCWSCTPLGSAYQRKPLLSCGEPNPA